MLAGCLAATSTVLAGAPRLARADTYPSRPVTIVLGFSPGSMIDSPRAVANELTAALGQPFLIETEGGGGVLAANTCQATADGYTC